MGRQPAKRLDLDLRSGEFLPLELLLFEGFFYQALPVAVTSSEAVLLCSIDPGGPNSPGSVLGALRPLRPMGGGHAMP